MSSDKQRLIQKDKPSIKAYDREKNKDTQLPEIGESSQSSIQFTTDKPQQFPQYVAAITAALSAVSSGVVLGWTSAITPELENGQYHNISINKEEMGWIGSFVTLGALTMCFPFGIVCDLIGRRIALLLLIIPFSVGWSLIVWANSLLMLYFGRFITGTAVGASCVAVPMYVNEIAHKNIRGTLGSYFQLMVTVGVLIAYLAGKFASLTHYTVLCGMIPFIYFILFVFQPESPLYSLKKGKVATAYIDLIRLRGPDYNVEAEIDGMRAMLESGSSNISIYAALRKPAASKAFVIALSLMFFQQLSGINAIIFYTSDIFVASGAKLDPQISAIIVGSFQVIATFVASLAIEKVGRRMLLITSNFVMAFAIIFLGLFFTLKDRNLVSNDYLNILTFLPIVSVCLYVIMFSIGLGPIPWSISGELFRPELKSFATASAGTFNWFLAFLVTKFYLEMQVKIGGDVVFYLFSLILFCGALFCYVMVPETKGKTIEEVQKDLEG